MMNKKFNVKNNIGNLIFIVFLFPAYFLFLHKVEKFTNVTEEEKK